MPQHFAVLSSLSLVFLVLLSNASSLSYLLAPFELNATKMSPLYTPLNQVLLN